MYRFLKWRFLFSSLVLLQIIKAITKCIFSVAIKVSHGIESILKPEENALLSQNVFPRKKITSISNHDLRSNFVNRNIKPTSVRFLVSNIPSGKKFTVRHTDKHKVVANFSDVTYDDLNDFQNRAVTVKSRDNLVCLKLDRTVPGKILKSSTPMYHDSKASRLRKIQNKTNSNKIPKDRKPTVQNAERVLIHNICNASAENTSLKLDASDKVHKLKLNEPNRSENKFSENVSVIIPEQITRHGHKSPSANSVDFRHRNLKQENKITQSSERQSFIDDECRSEIVTVMHSAYKCDDNESENQNSLDDEWDSELVSALHNASLCPDNESENPNSIDDVCDSELITSIHNSSQCDDNESQKQNKIDDESYSELVTAVLHAFQCNVNESENQNSIDDECDSDLVAAIHNVSQCDDNESKEQNSIDDDCHSELVTALEKVFQFQNNENHLSESEKNGHIKENNCPVINQVVEVKEENKLSAPNADGNLTPCLKVNDNNAACSNEAGFHADINTIPEKCDVRCRKNQNIDDELNELLDQHANIDKVIDVVINTASNLSTASSQKEASEILKTATSVYLAFLREINPHLQEVETELLNLSKVHYCKSLFTKDQIKSVSVKLYNIIKKSFEVNADIYQGYIIKYTNGITEVLQCIQDNILTSMRNSNCMKRSFFLKLVTRSLAEQRDILFKVNEETIALQKQIQKVGKVVSKQIKNRRRK